MHLYKKLGASLYIPATHPDLLSIANGEKLKLKSMIFCLEDSIALHDVPRALLHLAHVLSAMTAHSEALRFVRVRHPEMLMQILALSGSEKLTGFVLPKFTEKNLPEYQKACLHTTHWLMPTLETIEVFDEQAMISLRNCLLNSPLRTRILALRIGGNDLLALLGLRRQADLTIYDTPLGILIARLVFCFRPYGFELSAPVFEQIDNKNKLLAEIKQDLSYGLISKTAIHPQQIPWIESCYAVPKNELEMAQAILMSSCPAVFKMHGAMCEVATHHAWAKNLTSQAEIFGLISTQ